MTGPRRRSQSRDLFIDSSAFFAAASAHDPNFAAARKILERAGASGTPLVTTVYVVAETHALFLAKAGPDAGVRFLRRMDTTGIQVVRPTPDDETAAREIVYGYDDKDFSLTDAISFAVMNRLGIGTAFTFDGDFSRFGFAEAVP